MSQNLKKIQLNVIVLIQILLFFSCKNEVSEERYIPLIAHCDTELCKSVLYDIKLSKHNLSLKVKEGFVSEEEAIKYCLTTNTGCGTYIFFMLEKMIDNDTVKFKFLDEKYFIRNQEVFLNNLIEESLAGTLANINKIENDIFEVCSCK